MEQSAETDVNDDAFPKIGDDHDFLDHVSLYNDGHNIGVTSLNGQLFAVGLTWLTTDDDEKQNGIYKKTSALDCDFYCFRSAINQCGFGKIEDGHKIGMPALATIIADSVVGEWHGVFKTDDGWHYIAAHADYIAPDGDKFFKNEQDAYNYFIEESKKLKWPKTYVPNHWNYEGNDKEITYEGLIEGAYTTHLKPANIDAIFSGKINKSMAFLGGGLIAVILMMSFFSNTMLAQLLPSQIEAPTPQLIAGDTIAIPPREVEEKIDPMIKIIDEFSLVNPSDFIEKCMQSIDNMMVSLPGWDMTYVTCDDRVVDASWQKTVGSLSTIKPYINQFPNGTSTVFSSRNSFYASYATDTSLDNENMELAPRENILLTLNNRFSALGNMDVRDIRPDYLSKAQDNNRGRRLANAIKTPEEIAAEEKRTINDLPSLGVSFRTKNAPIFIKEYFNISGLKLNKVVWDVKQSEWLFDMRIYLLPQNYKTKDDNDA